MSEREGERERKGEWRIERVEGGGTRRQLTFGS